MNAHRSEVVLLVKLSLAGCLVLFWPLVALPQWPWAAPTTPDAQRNALKAVQSGVKWLQNATRSAPNFGTQGEGTVGQAFQTLRQSYSAFRNTLTQQQLAYGANDLAELDAGLDILEEAFVNYRQALAVGQPANSALRNMCRVLRQGSDVWLQQLNKRCAQLRVGWG